MWKEINNFRKFTDMFILWNEAHNLEAEYFYLRFLVQQKRTP